MTKRKSDNENKEVTKKPKVLNTDIEDFGKIYGTILYNSAFYWNYHSDSGCFYDVCQMKSFKQGNWTAIYQPSKEMKEYDGGKYYIILKYKKNITERQVKTLQTIIKQVEKLFLESYNDILKVTKNRWSSKVNGTIEEVAQIIYPFKLDGTLLKMCFELRGMEEGRCNDHWVPEKLSKWLGLENNYYSLFDENDEVKKDIVYDENGLPEELGHFTELAEPATI